MSQIGHRSTVHLSGDTFVLQSRSVIRIKVVVSLRRPTPIGHTVRVSFPPSTGDPGTGGRSARRSRPARVVGPVLVLAGMIVVVVGTFAPWLTAGGIDRNSYAIAGIVDRLSLAGDGFGSAALSFWPLIGPIAMVALITGILQWWRTSAVISIVLGLLTGVIGGGVLAAGHSAAGIEVVHAGPMITVVGAATAVLGGVVLLVAHRSSRGQARTAIGPLDAPPQSVEPSAGIYRQRAQQVPDGSR